MLGHRHIDTYEERFVVLMAFLTLGGGLADVSHEGVSDLSIEPLCWDSETTPCFTR